MAIFDSDNSAEQACLCALEIIDSSEEFTKIAEKHDLPVGIGINYGQVMIGNIGSAEHLDYSAIGETVNVAARLCGHANSLEINVSKEVLDIANNASGLKFSSPIMVKLKGLEQPVPVYQLTRNDNSLVHYSNMR